MSNSLKRTLISLVVPVILICIWTIFANKIDNPIILPKLSQVLSNFIHATDDFIGLGSLPKNISVSIIRVMLGYLVGTIVALPLGIFMGYKEKINLLFSKTINIIRPVPSICDMSHIDGYVTKNNMGQSDIEMV
ncbi:hypothetical protein [Tissierella sp.]|uniref:ABC transporter permease n=1 Tax=Tissierella sp. TaxID=41274 RepID=UPI0028AE0C12|nr:hypothetical protein [Tissierella sp.]